MDSLYFCFIFFTLNFYIANAKDAKLEKEVDNVQDNFNFFTKNIMGTTGNFFEEKDNAVNALETKMIVDGFTRLDESKTKLHEFNRKVKIVKEKLKDAKFTSQLNFIYDHLSPEERVNFGTEVFDNIEVYDNLLSSDLSQGELVQLYKFLYAFGKDNKNKNLSKNIFKGKCFRFILRTCGVNGIKELSEFFRCIVDKYNTLPLELRQMLEKISEQIENNMKKNGLDAFFGLLMSDIEAIRGNILSNEHVSHIIKEIQTIMSMKQIKTNEEKKKFVEYSVGFMKYGVNFNQYKNNFFTAKNMLSCQKTLAGVQDKVNICLRCCKKPEEQNAN